MLVPKFVQKRLENGETFMADDCGEVTLLFCDIYQFDKLITSAHEDIVYILDEIFKVFDQKTVSNGL